MKKNTTIILLSFSLMLTGVCCKWNVQDQPSGGEAPHDPDTTENSFGYENEAEQYESADRVIWQKPDLVIQQLGDVEGKVVADLGAGTGYFSRRIAYKGAKVIAIDIDPKAIQWMEEQKARFPLELQDRLVIRLAEPSDPKLNPNEVNIVLLVNTYSYIQDRVPYFTRLKECIRPGGYVVIIDFKKKETPFGPPIGERVDGKEVEKELIESGYSIVNMDETSLDYQYIIKAQKN
jgi:SAM-dependent methyltransferase